MLEVSLSFLVKLIISTCTCVLMHGRWDFPPTMERKSSVSLFIVTLSQSYIPVALSLSMDPLYKALFP